MSKKIDNRIREKIDRESKYGDRIRSHEITGCLRKAWLNRFYPITRKAKYHNPYEVWGRIIENTMRLELPKFLGWFDDVYVENHVLAGHPDFVNFNKRTLIENKFHLKGGVRAKDIAQASIYAGLLDYDNFAIRVCQLDMKNLLVNWVDYSYQFDREIFRKQIKRAEFFRRTIEEEDLDAILYFPRYKYECSNCSQKPKCELFLKRAEEQRKVEEHEP